MTVSPTQTERYTPCGHKIDEAQRLRLSGFALSAVCPACHLYSPYGQHLDNLVKKVEAHVREMGNILKTNPDRNNSKKGK